MKIRGMGGYWAIGFSASQAYAVHNAEYEVLTEIDFSETRSAGCGGWAEALPRVRRVVHAILKVAEDDAFYPQALGFTEGRELTFYLKRGELAQYDKIEQTIVQNVRVVNDATKARRVEVICTRGRYLRNMPFPLLAVQGL